LKEENRRLRSEIRGSNSFYGLIGRNPAMLELYDRIHRVANLKTTVLVLGESGTGKELVARAIHADSGRAENPFVAVNCWSPSGNTAGKRGCSGMYEGHSPALCLKRPDF